MNRTEAAAIASRKAKENRDKRKREAAADLLRTSGWLLFPPGCQVVRVEADDQFVRDVSLFTVEVPNEVRDVPLPGGGLGSTS